MSSLEQRLAELGATGSVDVTTLKSPGAGGGHGHGHGQGHVDIQGDTKRRVSLG